MRQTHFNVLIVGGGAAGCVLANRLSEDERIGVGLVEAGPDYGTFDVERWPNHHVAFGGYGVHHCLGASLARLELKVLFEEVLARMPDIRFANDEPLERRPNNFITGIEKMPVAFTPSRASA